MISAAARVFERLFATVLVPAAGALRAVAWIAFAVVLAAAIAQAARVFRAARHGWETATVVRCRKCGAVATDPRDPRCANGHAVRFPPGAAEREDRRRAVGGRIAFPAAGILAVASAAAITAGVVAAAQAFRIADVRAPALAAAAGACGFLLFSAGAVALLRASSTAPRGALDRGASAAAGAFAIFPAILLLALARAADPAPPRTIGSLWATPTALYVADGGKARRAHRVLPAGPASIAADIVVAQCPLFALRWTGLAGFAAGGAGIPWSGSGGSRARLVARLPSRTLFPFFTVDETRVVVATPPNARIWIVRSADGILFAGDTDVHPAFDAGGSER